jgi:hypothetical protein
MRLICPACGATSSPEAMTNDALARETMAIIVKMAPPIPLAVLSYLGLFRCGAERALAWKKAKRLAQEITELTGAGYVSVQGRIDRDCPPRIWAAAMESMATNPTIKRPMNGHNYLRKVAYDLAEEAATTMEASTRAAEQSHQRPGQQQSGPVRLASINPLAHLMED